MAERSNGIKYKNKQSQKRKITYLIHLHFIVPNNVITLKDPYKRQQITNGSFFIIDFALAANEQHIY